MTISEFKQEQGKLRNRLRLPGKLSTRQFQARETWIKTWFGQSASASWVAERAAQEGVEWHGTEVSILPLWTAVGGYGWAPTPGTKLAVVFDDEQLLVVPIDKGIPLGRIRVRDLISIEVGGPGATTTGGGFIGGGFGVTGAIGGMIAADVLNALTTRVHINTLLYVAGAKGALVAHTSSFLADELQLFLTPLTGAIAQREFELTHSPVREPDSLDRLGRVHELFQQGAIDKSEYDAIRARLMTELT